MCKWRHVDQGLVSLFSSRGGKAVLPSPQATEPRRISFGHWGGFKVQTAGKGSLTFSYTVSTKFCVCVGRKLESLGESSILPLSELVGSSERKYAGNVGQGGLPSLHSAFTVQGQHSPAGRLGVARGAGWAALSFCCN